MQVSQIVFPYSESERHRIIIFGCGGHARSVANAIREIDDQTEILFVDNNVKENEIILGFRTEQGYDIEENDKYIIAVGDNMVRSRLYHKIRKAGRGCCISVISVRALIGKEADVGNGTFVAHNAYLGPQSKAGIDTIINTGSIIEHEAVIGNHTHIAPNVTVCGRSKIGNYVFCGAGSTIIDKVNICDGVTVGAGAVVVKDITEPGIYVGVPARKIM